MTASSVPKELAGRGGAAFLPLTAPTPGPCPPPGLYPVLPQRSPPERRPPRSLTARQARLQAGEASRWLFPRWALTPGALPALLRPLPSSPAAEMAAVPGGTLLRPLSREEARVPLCDSCDR